jgi:hypothetical protein
MPSDLLAWAWPIVMIATMFINSTGAAWAWAEGRPRWAGIYATGFVCGAIALVGAAQ